MKNITLSADEALLDEARRRAKAERRTLNAAFREWLTCYVGRAHAVTHFDALMRELSEVDAGRTFTRDELNAR